MDRVWTLTEARQALPEVQRLLSSFRVTLADLRDTEAQLVDLRIVWGEDVLKGDCPAHAEWTREQERHRTLRDDVQEGLDAFATLGCELKDADQGLVDFRGLLGDRVVYLCWRENEADIAWWHPLEAGFTGRRPIPGA